MSASIDIVTDPRPRHVLRASKRPDDSPIRARYQVSHSFLRDRVPDIWVWRASDSRGPKKLTEGSLGSKLGGEVGYNNSSDGSVEDKLFWVSVDSRGRSR